MKLPFDEELKRKYYQLLDQVFDSHFWSEGRMLKTFENKFEAFVGTGARAVANGGAGLLAILDYIDVRDKDVIVPSNTFWATALAVKKAGGNVVYADCNREDLCLSFEDMKHRVKPRTKAVVVVHIGGHIAFEIDAIAAYCAKNGIYLVEDCAHAHGATWNGRSAGQFGFAGAYSFYATKTMPTGDGGMVVSKDRQFLEWLEKYRNYGKSVINGQVTYPVKDGFNFRINEFTAALGIVQLDRINDILDWKHELADKYDAIFENRVRFPRGMVSGYYKYIVFGYEGLKEETGRVFAYSDLCHVIESADVSLKNAEWIAQNHKCPPIYFGWEAATYDVDQLGTLLLS